MGKELVYTIQIGAIESFPIWQPRFEYDLLVREYGAELKGTCLEKNQCEDSLPQVANSIITRVGNDRVLPMEFLDRYENKMFSVMLKQKAAIIRRNLTNEEERMLTGLLFQEYDKWKERDNALED
jgi:hypothetical protein